MNPSRSLMSRWSWTCYVHKDAEDLLVYKYMSVKKAMMNVSHKD